MYCTRPFSFRQWGNMHPFLPLVYRERCAVYKGCIGQKVGEYGQSHCCAFHMNSADLTQGKEVTTFLPRSTEVRCTVIATMKTLDTP